MMFTALRSKAICNNAGFGRRRAHQPWLQHFHLGRGHKYGFEWKIELLAIDLRKLLRCSVDRLFQIVESYVILKDGLGLT
jgi:hypothetical protein